MREFEVICDAKRIKTPRLTLARDYAVLKLPEDMSETQTRRVTDLAQHVRANMPDFTFTLRGQFNAEGITLRSLSAGNNQTFTFTFPDVKAA
jgi:hypothetical protein